MSGQAWTWEAGPCSGVCGDPRLARRHASAALRSGRAQVAVLQEVTLATGAQAMDDCYRPVARTRTEGLRVGAGIRWTRAG